MGEAIHTIISPAFKIEPLEPKERPKDPDYIAFTSMNGVDQAVRLGLRAKSGVFCVGDATANHATSQGYHALSAAGDAEDLTALIKAQNVEGSLLHVSGEHITGNLVGALRQSGIEAQRLIAYRQASLRPTAEFANCLKGTGRTVLPLFSPRSVRIMAGLEVGENTHLVAMSEAVATAAIGHNVSSMIVADAPNFEAMLDATCKKLTL